MFPFSFSQTITVLSLLLQTAGMAPVLCDGQKSSEVDEDHILQTYWHEEFNQDLRRQPLLRLMNIFLRSEQIEIHFPYKRIRKSVDDDRYADFSLFEKDVE
jgi:hypothetical protein